ncbi:unnamed protein product [Closterium sp. Naga37s-1]|nr:unnamed protein product [Closterium sp. Naga37s-1]
MATLWNRVQRMWRDRWLGLILGMWLQACGGISYAFSLYSAALKDKLQYSQEAVDGLGTAKDIGGNVGIVSGLLIDLMPAWAILAIGAGMHLFGSHLLTTSLFRLLPPPRPLTPRRPPPPPPSLIPLLPIPPSPPPHQSPHASCTWRRWGSPALRSGRCVSPPALPQEMEVEAQAYAMQAQAFAPRHDLPVQVIQMCAFIMLGTNGATWFNTAVLVTCIRNFEGDRGVVVGLLKGFIGLSGAIFTQLYSALYSPHTAPFLLLCALLPPLVALLAMAVIRPMNPHLLAAAKRDSGDSTRFSFLYVVGVGLALYLMLAMTLQETLSLSRPYRLVSMAGMVLLLALPISLPPSIRISITSHLLSPVSLSLPSTLSPLNPHSMSTLPSPLPLSSPSPWYPIQWVKAGSPMASKLPLHSPHEYLDQLSSATSSFTFKPPATRTDHSSLPDDNDSTGGESYPLLTGGREAKSLEGDGRSSHAWGVEAGRGQRGSAVRVGMDHTLLQAAVTPECSEVLEGPRQEVARVAAWDLGGEKWGPQAAVTPAYRDQYHQQPPNLSSPLNPSQPLKIPSRLPSASLQAAVLRHGVWHGVRAHSHQQPGAGPGALLLSPTPKWTRKSNQSCNAPKAVAESLGSASVGALVALVSIWNFLGRMAAGYVSEQCLKRWCTPRPLCMLLVQAAMGCAHLLFSIGVSLPQYLHLPTLCFSTPSAAMVGLAHGALDAAGYHLSTASTHCSSTQQQRWWGRHMGRIGRSCLFAFVHPHPPSPPCLPYPPSPLSPPLPHSPPPSLPCFPSPSSRPSSSSLPAYHPQWAPTASLSSSPATSTTVNLRSNGQPSSTCKASPPPPPPSLHPQSPPLQTGAQRQQQQRGK